jgi:hypothetical protein
MSTSRRHATFTRPIVQPADDSSSNHPYRRSTHDERELMTRPTLARTAVALIAVFPVLVLVLHGVQPVTIARSARPSASSRSDATAG